MDGLTPPTCTNCGNDQAAEGHELCVDCLEELDADEPLAAIRALIYRGLFAAQVRAGLEADLRLWVGTPLHRVSLLRWAGGPLCARNLRSPWDQVNPQVGAA